MARQGVSRRAPRRGNAVPGAARYGETRYGTGKAMLSAGKKSAKLNC